VEIRKLTTVKTSLLIAVILILIGVTLRLVPHIPNFAPIGAIALFGGAVLGKRIALWLPLVAMLISDSIIGFYSGIEFTWLGFLLIAVFGMVLSKRGFFARVTLGAIGTGVIFFAVSNFGVWLTSGMYTHTLAGFVQCYYMALPFYRMTFLSDMFYSAAIFGVYEAAMYYVRKPTIDIYLPVPSFR
jgi:hypothetical protein